MAVLPVEVEGVETVELEPPPTGHAKAKVAVVRFNVIATTEQEAPSVEFTSVR
jgi:hypothetical protein